MAERAQSEAYVTLATNDTYVVGCLVLGQSLRKTGTKRQLVVLITSDVSDGLRKNLRRIFDIVQEVDILSSTDYQNLQLLGRPGLNVTFSKFHCWRLTQFKKGVFLDADALVIQNVDDLFDREELSAAPDPGWPDCFNSGVFVFTPSEKTYASLLEFAGSKGTFDGGDQGLLNMFFSDWPTKDIARHLPFTYNMVSQAFYSYLPAFNKFRDNIKIVHFIGPIKPWQHTFDPLTHKVTPLPGSSFDQNFLQLWWDIFVDSIYPVLDPVLLQSCVTTKPVVDVVALKENPSRETYFLLYPYQPPSVDQILSDETPSLEGDFQQLSTLISPPLYIDRQQTPKLEFDVTLQRARRPIGYVKPSLPFSHADVEPSHMSSFDQSLVKTQLPLTVQPVESMDMAVDFQPVEGMDMAVNFQPVEGMGIPISVQPVEDEDTKDLSEADKEVIAISESVVPQIIAVKEDEGRPYAFVESFYSTPPLSYIDPDAPPIEMYTALEFERDWSSVSFSKRDSSDFSLGGATFPSREKEIGSFSGPEPAVLAESKSFEPAIAENIASLHLHDVSSETGSEYERRMAWEQGQVDYMGEDSFENIQRKLDAKLSEGSIPTQ